MVRLGTPKILKRVVTFRKKDLNTLRRKGIQQTLQVSSDQLLPIDWDSLIANIQNTIDANNVLLSTLSTHLLVQFGYSQQPAFVNTNQQVVTILDSAGDELFNSRANRGYVQLTDGTETVNVVARGHDGVGKAQNDALFCNSVIHAVKAADDMLYTLRMDDALNLKTTLAGGSIGDGQRTVTTAGSRVTLSAASVPCKKVWIQGETGNTADIYIGGSTVSNTSGISIEQHQSSKEHIKVEIEIDDLVKVFIDAEVSGEGVIYTYIT